MFDYLKLTGFIALFMAAQGAIALGSHNAKADFCKRHLCVSADVDYAGYARRYYGGEDDNG
jgi:hypothetical protein